MKDALEKEMDPTPVFLPGKSHVQRSLWATVHGVPRESDTTEQINSSNTGQQALKQAWHLGSAPERGAKGSGPSGVGVCPHFTGEETEALRKNVVLMVAQRVSGEAGICPQACP